MKRTRRTLGRTKYGPPLAAVVPPKGEHVGIRLVEVDGRTLEGRKFWAVYGSILDDLGGPGQVSTAQMMAAQTAAALGVWTANKAPEIVAGINGHLPAFVTATNALLRHLKVLGFKRQRGEDGPPTLEAIVLEHATATGKGAVGTKAKRPRPKAKRPRLRR